MFWRRLKEVDGYTENEDSYETFYAVCPYCDTESEYKRMFGSEAPRICPNCKKKFTIDKVWINDNHLDCIK